METKADKKKVIENEMMDRQSFIDEMRTLINKRKELIAQQTKINDRLFYLRNRHRIEYNSVNKVKIVVQNSKYDTTLEIVLNTVAEYYKIGVEEIKKRNRTAGLVIPRHVAMYLSREVFGVTASYIGFYYEGRDHSTVLNACKRTQGLIDTEKEFKKEVEEIQELLLHK